MTAFVKTGFEYNGDYLHYNTGTERMFVARFKHRGPVTKAKFQAALIKHYSVENYFGRLGGWRNPHGELPLQILMNDGILVLDRKAGKFILDGKVL